MCVLGSTQQAPLLALDVGRQSVPERAYEAEVGVVAGFGAADAAGVGGFEGYVGGEGAGDEGQRGRGLVVCGGCGGVAVASMVVVVVVVIMPDCGGVGVGVCEGVVGLVVVLVSWVLAWMARMEVCLVERCVRSCMVALGERSSGCSWGGVFSWSLLRVALRLPYWFCHEGLVGKRFGLVKLLAKWASSKAL